MGRKEILGAALLALRALAANPVDDMVALTILATTSQAEAKAAFFDSQQISFAWPERVKKKPQNGGKDLPRKGEIFPSSLSNKREALSVLSNKPQATPLRL